MGNSKKVEIAVGIFVFIGMIALLVLAINVSNVSSFTYDKQYRVVANFENISGLKPRSAVTLAGVNIGRVTSITVDKETFEAVVEMHIDERFNSIPVDSSAAIYTAGLLGEKYVGIEVGGAPDFLKDGSEIRLTQSSLVLEKMVGQYLFNNSGQSQND